VVKCLIKEGGADIDKVISVFSALSLAARHGKYSLAQWLIEEGALIPTTIWSSLSMRVEEADAAELSSLLKVLILLPMSPDQETSCPPSSPSCRRSTPSFARGAASSRIDCQRPWSSNGPQLAHTYLRFSRLW
jgi:hypothetical protein